MAYDAKDKALAVGIINRHGGMTAQALADIRAALELPELNKATVYRWWVAAGGGKKATGETATATTPETATDKKRGYQPVTPDIVEGAERALDDLFETVARRYLERALDDKTLERLGGKDAVTAAAIAVDKMRLIRGLPTAIIELMPVVVKLHEALETAGLKPSDVFERMIQRVQAQRETIDHDRSD